jgi:glycosyltransferase 2 family protein
MTILALAAAILLIILVRSRGARFDWDRFVRTISQLDWAWLAASMLLMLLTYLFRAVRWDVLLRPSGRSPGIGRLTSDTAIGFTAGVLLGRVGEIVRPYLISTSAGVSMSSQLAALLLERLLDLLSILAIFGFALLRVSPGRAVGPELGWVLSAGGYLAALLGLVCLILLIAFRNFSELAEKRILGAIEGLSLKYYERSKKLITSLAAGLESTRDPQLLLLLGWYTLVVWGTIVASYYCLFHSFRVLQHLSLTDVVVLLGMMAFGSIVQLPGVGGGVQVVCILCLTKLYGVPFETASAVAVAIWFLTVVVIVPFGLVCAVHQGWNWRKIRQLTAQPAPEEGVL